MPRVIHFEIPVDNPERAVKFYSEVFSWKVEKWPGPVDYWLATTGGDKEPGINGALARRSEQMRVVTNTIDVPSLDDCIKKIEANGGKVMTPRTAIPGVGYMVYFQDTEGNVSGAMQSDKAAK